MLFATVKSYSQITPGDIYKPADTIRTGTDTLATDTLSGKYNLVQLWVNDTGSTYTDSIVVESYNSKLGGWARIGLRRVKDNVVTLAANQAGEIAIYELIDPAPNIIRRRLANAVYVSGRRVITQLRLIAR